MADSKKSKSLNERLFAPIPACIALAIAIGIVAGMIRQNVGAAIILGIIVLLMYALWRQRRNHKKTLEKAQTKNVRHDIYHHRQP